MHTKEAKKLKVTVEQIDHLSTWKETNIYSEKEKIALELAENMTLISARGVNDELYNKVENIMMKKIM